MKACFGLKDLQFLESQLEFAWGYWINLLTPLESYVLLVFYYIRNCFVVFMCLQAGTLVGLDAYA